MDLSEEVAELWGSLGAPPMGRSLILELIAARDGEGVSSIARELAFSLARRERRRVWLIDLDLMGQSQAQAFADDPVKFGELGAAAQASPDGSMFFTVQPPLTRPDGRPWPDTRYIGAHSVGGAGLWVTRFRREAMRANQGVHVTPTPAYWSALRRHADVVIVDAPAAQRSQAGLTVAPFMDAVVLVVAADETDHRGPVQLRDDLEAAGAHCAGVFVNRVDTGAPGFLRGAVP